MNEENMVVNEDAGEMNPEERATKFVNKVCILRLYILANAVALKRVADAGAVAGHRRSGVLGHHLLLAAIGFRQAVDHLLQASATHELLVIKMPSLAGEYAFMAEEEKHKESTRVPHVGHCKRSTKSGDIVTTGWLLWRSYL
ncbi:hypothetical protein HPP92_004080 [Vanilla planifolia]|uniref:Uncharacterized protein n=1 Tax=Vanilla planifolia TaxID=51239 RepID=A0A835VG38_VANPL|nr:hypothetical protein HPP92_004080 [Vanilla planifolia]